MNDVLLAYERRPKHTVRNTIAAVIILALFIWSLDVINYPGIFEEGINIARNLFRSFFNPTWDLIFSYHAGSIPRLMFETIGIAFLGTLLGAILSVPFAFLTAKNIVGRVPSVIGNTIITTIRSFPFFITALMFVRVTGGGAMTGVLTIGVLSIGMISKLYIEIIEDIDPGIIQALDALGATTFQKIRYGIIPQLTASMLSVIIYRFEINVKNATVLGIVGAGGIGVSLILAMNAGRWRDASAALWGIIIVVLIVDFFSTRIRAKLVNG
ncbi:phosphonate ABC transporter, permease protein PhnE [Tenericutes bacterium MZ-XQ]|jgi:phosphonate transport system permease protein|nr:phosphonate ABC transporter, permease protein PhnE [Tenericutes bacterium MZ-XQ]